MRMNAAETSASSAIADCPPLAVVSRSCTTAEMETFISDVSTTSTNIAIASRTASRVLPLDSSPATAVASVLIESQCLSADEPEVALRRAQPLDAVGCYKHVLLERDETPAGDRNAVLEGVHVTLLDGAARGVAVPVPERGEQRASIVDGPAQLVAECVHRLLVARPDEACAGCCVDLMALDAGTEHVGARVHRGPDRVPGGHHVLGRLALALVEQVPHALQVAAVAVL